MTKRGYLGDLEEIVLLAAARCQPEAYGMRIRQEIEEQSGRAVAIGAVYASIERLEERATSSRRRRRTGPTAMRGPGASSPSRPRACRRSRTPPRCAIACGAGCA